MSTLLFSLFALIHPLTAKDKVMRVYLSICHIFYFDFIFYCSPFDHRGRNEGSMCWRIVLLWMMLALFSQDPLGNKGMLPKEGRKDKKRAMSEYGGWAESSHSLWKSTQPIIWFGSLLLSHTNDYSIVWTSVRPLYDHHCGADWRNNSLSK